MMQYAEDKDKDKQRQEQGTDTDQGRTQNTKDPDQDHGSQDQTTRDQQEIIVVRDQDIQTLGQASTVKGKDRT